MSEFISKAALEARRIRFKPGTRVELVQFSDPYSSLKPGDRGTVEHVDDAGGCHIAFDNGSHLAALWQVDEIKVLTVIPPEVVEQILKLRLLPGVPNMFAVKEVFEFAMQLGGFDELCDFLFMHTNEYSRFILSGEREF
jgi:hypothetical protein